MFSTFTGNSRRPRNVNLSGQAGNPFANTAWSPSAVSNATKTVSNAQADREKRHAERQRLKAAGKIQQTWRGHRTRTRLRESRRAAFDELYSSVPAVHPTQRLPQAFTLLLSFFTSRRSDDIRRLTRYAHDSESVDLQAIAPPGIHHSRVQQLVRLLVEALDTTTSQGNLHLVEGNIDVFSQAVSAPTLASAILHEMSSASASQQPQDGLLWLLAHFIDLGRLALDASHRFKYLETLYTLLSALSQDIRVRINIKASAETSDSDEPHDEALLQPLDPYVASRLLSLVENVSISKLLQDFSSNLAGSSAQELRGTSLLAGYILTLLRCFPGSADDIRMRLFLEQIPAGTGNIPTVKFLWHIMKQTTVLHKLRTESERPVDVLCRYLRATSDTPNATIEEQEWRVILLFLELYIFILRLSDDEDFFSGIFPHLLDDNSPVSRIRSCSLSLDDIKGLTIFLKNTAFTLHYRAQEFSKSREDNEVASKSRMDSYFGSAGSTTRTQGAAPSRAATRLDLDSLRSISTEAMKMLYERDSRKQFLPVNHWLMTNKLDKEDFIGAVIAEERRQNLEGEGGSDEERDSDVEADLETDAGFYSTIAGQRLSRHVRLERLKAQQIRVQHERRMAELGPKLEILKHMPFVVPFETRVMIFRQFIHLDRARRDGVNPMIHIVARHHAQIRRTRLFEDAYQQFYKLGDGFKDPIQITFVDQFGAREAGIDGGGVTKEFLISVTSEAFGGQDKGPGMFTSNEKGLLYPDPTAADVLRESLREGGLTESDPEWKDHVSSLLRRFEFLGRIVGKCMYEGILVDLAFAGFFLLKWASAGPNDENSYKGSVNDLRDMDEDLYKGMLRVKNYSGDLSELGIDFTVTDQISQPGEQVKTTTRKLISNGDQVYVTNDNRLLYISYVARHRLVVQPSLQTAAFLRGLRAIIRPSWLSMFNQSELQRLVGGDSSEIDIEDLRRNTVYSGLYEIGDDGQEHDTIQLFWKVMRGFTDTQRRDVLKYVSSTPRAPLLGFSQLKPKFSIRDGGTDEERLPSTSTCVNLLKLPRYTSEANLREKLLYAVTSGAGFDLS
ncbi:ubiquitin-protein ligase (E3) [Neonectria punicea]|uniref:HECT-type E3 ubiquitin transferase n=1 Tax=Neonectria punicea TaxID=979145 RepID=A0ABR1GKZ0_9HYPO